jgi:hypothetical protein
MNKVSNAGTAAAVTNLLIRYEQGNMIDTKYVIQSGELLDYYQREGMPELINRGVHMGIQVKQMLPISPSISGAVYVIASQISDAFLVNEFFDKLIEGYGLQEGDAIAALRNWVIRRRREDLRTKRHEYFYVLARTWNGWATNEEVSRVQLPRDGLTSSAQIPKLVPVKLREPAAVTEDNPAVTPYSRTRKEQEVRNRTTPKAARRKAS